MNEQRCTTGGSSAAAGSGTKVLCPVCGKGSMVVVPLFAGLIFIARCSDTRKCGTRTNPCSTAPAARHDFEAEVFFIDD